MTCIFVGGYLRSGTTLLQSILCASPDCNPMVGEEVFLRGIVESYERGLALFDEHTRYYFDDREELRRQCADHVEKYIEKTARRFGNPKHLVLKHPHLTVNFPLLHDLLPEAKFVVVLRDPRDVVASALAAQKKGADEFGGADATAIARNLSRYYLSCIGCDHPTFQRQVLYVKYEDLIRRPDVVVRALQEFTGIDLSGFSPSLDNLRTKVDFDGKGARTRPLHSEHYGKAMTDARIGRYGEVLSPAEAEAVQGVCKTIVGLYRWDLPVFTMETADDDIRISSYPKP